MVPKPETLESFYEGTTHSDTGYNAFIPKFKTSTFVTSYLGIIIYLFNVMSCKFVKKTQRVSLDEMDLQTDRLIDDGSKPSSTFSRVVKAVLRK